MARKLRLFMSATAIILGVAFVAGSFIFTDTLGKAFDGIMSGSVGDVVVRPVGVSGDDSSITSKTVPASVVRDLASVPGAARADGNVTSFGTFVVSKRGKLIGGTGAPGIAVNYSDAPAARGAEQATIDRGRWPTKSGEVALDAGTAREAGYLVGENVTLVTSGSQPKVTATLVGTASFNGGSMLGASLAVFDTRTAQGLFVDGKDAFNDVWVTASEGTSQDDLRAAVAARLPKGFEAVTGDSAAEAAASEVQEALGFITTFLLVFAGVALLVGSFLIVNTFSILVAQRSRELALLRALGAGRRQVGRSVLLEALVVALFGSTVGLGLGLVLAMGIRAIFGRFGLDLSGTALVFQPRTVAVSYAVGLVVTMLAAYLPARRAGKVPPVAAMRDDVTVTEGPMRRRVVLGAALTLAGAAAMGLGLFGSVSRDMWWIGGGIAAVVLGVAMVSPLVGRPVIALLGWFYRAVFGAVGTMAEQNAVRNPRRTAATASALMIGVTLVSMMAVFGASAKASIDQVINQQFKADLVISNAIGQGFSPSIAEQVRALPGVASVSRFRFAPVKVEGDNEYTVAAEPSTIADAASLTLVSGSLGDWKDTTVLVREDEAAEKKLAVGDTLTLDSAGTARKFTVAGTYEDNPVVGGRYVLTLGGLTSLDVKAEDNFAYVSVDPGVSTSSVQRRVDALIKDLPTVTVKNQAAFAAEQRKPIDQMLYVIYALLGLAIIIAVLGIINTLALSVIERTREIGLLRAVGLSRRQLRRMLTLESVVISLLGASLGIVLGTSFGVAVQRALADDGIEVLSIPWSNIVVFLGVAAVVGVLAALWPGRRAARLDILRAITTE